MVRSRLDSLVAIQSKAKMIMTAAANKPSGIKGALPGRDDLDGQASPETLPSRIRMMPMP